MGLLQFHVKKEVSREGLHEHGILCVREAKFDILILFRIRIPVAARFKAWTCGRLLAGIVGSYPAGLWTCVYYECCVLSGRVLSVGLITRPEETYRVCVLLCDRESSIMRRPWHTSGCYSIKKKDCSRSLLEIIALEHVCLGL
jgi:hypothetical protein